MVPDVSDAEVAAYLVAKKDWDEKNAKAQGILTLRMAPSIRVHKQSTPHGTWDTLKRVFGKESVPAIFGDFKALIQMRLSGGNPVEEMAHYLAHVEHLSENGMDLPKGLVAMILLSAIPAKWDHLAFILKDETDVAGLDVDEICQALQAEWDQHAHPQPLANRLTAVKRKGPGPSYQKQGSSSQPQRQVEQQAQHAEKKRRTRRGGNKKQKGQQQQHQHGHSHIASSALEPMLVDTVPAAPRQILVSQPSRAAPTHTTLASFMKEGIRYTKCPTKRKEAPAPNPKIWPSINEARDLCEKLHVPKTAKNLKPLEIEAWKRSADSASLSKAKVEHLLPEPKYQSVYDDEIYNYDERLSWGDDNDDCMQADPAGDDLFGESSDEEDPQQLFTMPDYGAQDVDMEIADAAGLDRKGKGKEKRQVHLACTMRSTDFVEQCFSVPPKTETGLPIDRVSIHKSVVPPTKGLNKFLYAALTSLETSLNKIEPHLSSCAKCRDESSRGWILDSGASVHFTNCKNDLVDYEVVSDAHPVRTANAKTPLLIEGKGTVLLGHLVENNGKHERKVTRIYPVFYISGLSVRLLSAGTFLSKDKLELHGNARKLAYYKSGKQVLLALP